MTHQVNDEGRTSKCANIKFLNLEDLRGWMVSHVRLLFMLGVLQPRLPKTNSWKPQRECFSRRSGDVRCIQPNLGKGTAGFVKRDKDSVWVEDVFIFASWSSLVAFVSPQKNGVNVAFVGGWWFRPDSRRELRGFSKGGGTLCDRKICWERPTKLWAWGYSKIH